eukprot:CAMPEP_0113594940 /NCGR_PEP_ID=MMETSP0015_2-20120614/39370_1 /TAXON_ID=2838 /ORGANISM="Odontella" /LENGTH=105 /DNA_ID=CAMNT_0000502021 /DNA_START=449 /DNA_END=766 /DNA_ORIENTATION=- /assembly_acc=CAM_ASM_000160
MAKDDFGNYNPHQFALGYYFMEKAIDQCSQYGTVVLEPEDIFQQLEGAYDFSWSNMNNGKTFIADGGCIRDVPKTRVDRGMIGLLTEAGGKHLYCDQNSLETGRQ